MEKLYTIIKTISENKRLPLSDIANHIGLSRQAFFYRLKKGKISFEELKQIAEFVNVPLSELTGEKSEKEETRLANPGWDLKERLAYYENLIKEKDNIISIYRELIEEYRRNKKES